MMIIIIIISKLSDSGQYFSSTWASDLKRNLKVDHNMLIPCCNVCLWLENQKPWAIRKVLLVCFAGREVWENPPLLKLCRQWEDKDAVSQAHSVKQCSLAAGAHFTAQVTKTLLLLPMLSAGRRGPGVAPMEIKGLQLSSARLVAPKHPNTPGESGSMCSLIWAINHNFIWQKKCPENYMLQ